jgi:hypothetical protein
MEISDLIHFRLFKQDGTLLGVVESSKQLPPQWLPPKATTIGGRKNKGTALSSYLLLFKTSDITNFKQTRQISDWNFVSVGDEFWIKSGEKMEVFSPKVRTTAKDWKTLFIGCVNRYQCAGRFLELHPDIQMNFFTTLSVKDKIRILCVPTSYQKQFNKVEFKLEQLLKYCDYMAFTKERRAQEEARKRKEDEIHYKKELQRSRMESDDLFGDLDRLDDIRVSVGFEAHACYEIQSQSISDMMYLFSDVKTASHKLQEPVKLPVMVAFTHNDLKRDETLLNNIIEASKQGLINKDVLPMIYSYFVWRFNNILYPISMN